MRDRWRALDLVKWLSEKDDVVWISIIEPTPSAQMAGLPKLESYRGLRAITEIKNAKGAMEWHFLWETEGAVDRNEPRVSNSYASAGVTRAAVRVVEIRKQKWWKNSLLWILATGALASVATIVTNYETIEAFVLEWRHEPEMMLENPQTIQIASDSNESKEITILGDAFFRARLTDLSMKIVADPEYSAAAALPNGGDLKLPSLRRSVDVGQELKLRLPFDKVPAGRYFVILSGNVQTARRSAAFAPPQGFLRLDARAPVSAKKKSVTPWAPNAVQSERLPEALVDIGITFGRPKATSSNLRLVLGGAWIKGSIDILVPGAQYEIQSQNSPQSPKGIVVVLNNIPSQAFTSQTVRLKVQAPTSLTEAEWQKAVPEPEVSFEINSGPYGNTINPHS
jgi:hypothetical protein